MSYKSTVLDLNPAHFVFSNLIDEAAGGNNLTAVGATRQTTGTPGDGIPDYWQLDGVDDYLWAADAPAFDITAEHTVLWWVRHSGGTAPVAFGNYWAKGNDPCFQARINSTNRSSVLYLLRGGTGGEVQAEDNNYPPANAWHLVVCRYTGSNVEIRRVQGDGTLVLGDTRARTGTLGANDQLWTVGAQNDTGSNIQRFWAGDMVLPIIFDYALSNAQVTSIWEARNDPAVENLYATATGTIVDVVNEADNTTDLHLSVDDDPAAPDDDDWVNNAVDVT